MKRSDVRCFSHRFQHRGGIETRSASASRLDDSMLNRRRNVDFLFLGYLISAVARLR
jgi:hypothetical protein